MSHKKVDLTNKDYLRTFVGLIHEVLSQPISVITFMLIAAP